MVVGTFCNTLVFSEILDIDRQVEKNQQESQTWIVDTAEEGCFSLVASCVCTSGLSLLSLSPVKVAADMERALPVPFHPLCP